jgi:hypothetical protein
MFDGLIQMFQTNAPRATAVTIAMVIIFAGLLWVSIIDIKRRSVTFWKMLIASGLTIVCPLIVSLFYNCNDLKAMKWYLAISIPLWFFMLFINIKLNKDKFMGKADIDLLTALASMGICYSVWLWTILPPETVTIRITAFWYKSLGFLLMGAIVYLIIFMFMVMKRVIIGKQKIRDLVKGTKISIIPMFMPISVMMPYMIMMS